MKNLLLALRNTLIGTTSFLVAVGGFIGFLKLCEKYPVILIGTTIAIIGGIVTFLLFEYKKLP